MQDLSAIERDLLGEEFAPEHDNKSVFRVQHIQFDPEKTEKGAWFVVEPQDNGDLRARPWRSEEGDDIPRILVGRFGNSKHQKVIRRVNDILRRRFGQNYKVEDLPPEILMKANRHHAEALFYGFHNFVDGQGAALSSTADACRLLLLSDDRFPLLVLNAAQQNQHFHAEELGKKANGFDSASAGTLPQ